MESLPTLLLATAYAPPVSYFVKLYEHVAGTIALEGCEHYIKQSYRNRCRILGPNGVQSPHDTSRASRWDEDSGTRSAYLGSWGVAAPACAGTAHGLWGKSVLRVLCR